jgi:nitronate monooxygenase
MADVRELFGIEIPIVQAPMAGAQGSALAAAVAAAGGLGSLPCATLAPDRIRAEVAAIRARTDKPFALNFFCHTPPAATDTTRWRARLAKYYEELGAKDATPSAGRRPFDAATCAVVEELRPHVVSFHFGMPAPELTERVRKTGARIVGCATTVDEARWLAERGCDAIVAQGFEAGGHRGMFQSEDSAHQIGTFALVPQIVDAVKVPVIAAGGIADARGIVAAFALGASAVQLGTAFLFTSEATISAPHRAALERAKDDDSVLTNVISGRPARGIATRLVREVGPITTETPPFPLASDAIAPLRAAAEAKGSLDFSTLWIGQASRLAPRGIDAGELTKTLWQRAVTLSGDIALGTSQKG